MSATVTIARDFKPLTELDLTTREDMRELGLLARELIQTRTRQGVDANGNAFAPYSKQYAADKRAALGGGGVDLTVSGNMLNQITIVDLEDDSVTLGWAQ